MAMMVLNSFSAIIHSNNRHQTKHMQIKTKHLLTMLVVAGMSVAAFPANAATITFGDLLIGFRVTGGQGAGTDLVVRAGDTVTNGGNATTFRDATSSISSVVDVGAELTSLYGANWADRSDLSWSIVGVRSSSNTQSGAATNAGGDPGRTNYVSVAEGGAVPELTSGTARGNTANAINAINSLFSTTGDNGLGSAEAVSLASNTLGGWTEQINNNYFAVGTSTEASSASGIDATGLDLYRILHLNTGATPTGTIGVGSYEGTFSISSAGVVSFDVGAVPEPSRMLLAGIGFASLMFRRRRRSVA